MPVLRGNSMTPTAHQAAVKQVHATLNLTNTVSYAEAATAFNSGLQALLDDPATLKELREDCEYYAGQAEKIIATLKRIAALDAIKAVAGVRV